MTKGIMLRGRKLTRPVPCTTKENGVETKSQQSREEPFWRLFSKVGVVLFVLSLSLYSVGLWVQQTFRDPNYTNNMVPNHRMYIKKLQNSPTVDPEESLADYLPNFDTLDPNVVDAFSIATAYTKEKPTEQEYQFLQVAEQLRMEFASRYGGEESARAVLQRGLIVLTPDETIIKEDSSSSSTPIPPPHALAQRFLNARKQRNQFSMAVTGSSSAAGYGNYAHSAYGNIVQQVLKDVFSTLDIGWNVYQLAREHAGVFPLSWCSLQNVGPVDVVAYDFSQITSESLEALLRSLISSGGGVAPIVMVKDQTRHRALLQTYVNQGLLETPFLVDVQAAAKPFLTAKTKVRPVGFQQWNDFGGPPGAPGKTKFHLSQKQHELVGWMLSMHLLSALEWSVLGNNPAPTAASASASLSAPVESSSMALDSNPDPWSSLLAGVEKDGKWTVPPIHCRTAHESILPSNLNGLVVGGTVGEDLDVLLPRGPMFYTNGWVLDMEPSRKKEKQLMQQWDNMGFSDWNMAYWGIKASGVLSMYIPLAKRKSNKQISDLIEILVVCGSEQLNHEQECRLDSDVKFVLQGEETSAHLIESDAVSYQGKYNCVQVKIPATVKISKRARDSKPSKRTMLEDSYNYGMSLDLQVVSERVAWDQGPCSVAHVVWQERLA